MRLFEDNQLAQRLIAQARDECRRYEWQAVRAGWLKLYNQLAPVQHASAVGLAPASEADGGS